MDNETRVAIQDLCDEIQNLADASRNISMKSFNTSPKVCKLRALLRKGDDSRIMEGKHFEGSQWDSMSGRY